MLDDANIRLLSCDVSDTAIEYKCPWYNCKIEFMKIFCYLRNSSAFFGIWYLWGWRPLLHLTLICTYMYILDIFFHHNQGRHSNQCHSAMELVIFLPRLDLYLTIAYEPHFILKPCLKLALVVLKPHGTGYFYTWLAPLIITNCS